MPFETVFEYTQSIPSLLVIEYFYRGEKIEDPIAFFEENSGLYDFAFPTLEEVRSAINKYVLFGCTHKLIISEYGFHLIRR